MFHNLTCKCEVIKNFSPSWFASVMGTGIVAITSLFYSSYINFLKPLSYGIFYFNIFLFIVLLFPWITRWIKYKDEAIKDMFHPILSNFYATIGIALLVLSANFLIIAHNPAIAKILWIIGMLITIFFSILTPFIIFKGEHVKLDHISPAFFIPPVGLVVIPIAGAPLISSFGGIWQDAMILLNIGAWGAGFMIYISLLAICFYRFVLHHPLPEIMAPTIWIGLGPIGAGSIALANILKYTHIIHTKEPFYLFILFLWGFGIWWLLLAIMMTIHYMRKLHLPYGLSWWAFTFPLGAYVGSCRTLSNLFNMELIDRIGFTFFLLLFFIWAITLIKTLIHTYNGNVFKK